MLEKNDTYNKRSNSNLFSHCRIVLSRDLVTANLSSRYLTKRFNVNLNFTVTCRTNSLVYKRELTNRQEEIYELIKSMHDSGLGYKSIAKRLCDMKSKQLTKVSLRIITHFSNKEMRRVTDKS